MVGKEVFLLVDKLLQVMLTVLPNARRVPIRFLVQPLGQIPVMVAIFLAQLEMYVEILGINNVLVGP